ncbi:SAVMC3_10250 family protein [Streptomyces coeruleorubidus]|uniref:SAVMC3_10250 family protein n=1 Tax=Streptomyces coeruleorubidus TaxID=116188 RepID=UPI00382D1A6E
MRDLLYLSENKMRVLSPQVPQKLWRKAGFEAGVNVGLVSITTTLPGDSPQPSVAMLDPVVEMIEQEREVKWFTDEALQVGDWIQFEDEFFYGDAAPAGTQSSDKTVVTGLVYFAAQRSPKGTPFVLVGSSVNVLDRWQPPDSHVKTAGTYYMEAVRAYAARLAEMPDEAAQNEFTVPPFRGHGLVQALHYLTPIAGSAEMHSGWAAGPVMLRGHARVLAAPNDGIWGRAVLATPLYIEYAPDDA